jgi:hypothetical protein
MTLISKADALQKSTSTSTSEIIARSDTFNSSLYTPFKEIINGCTVTAKQVEYDAAGKPLWSIEVVTTDGRKATMTAPLRAQFNKSNFTEKTALFVKLNRELGGALSGGTYGNSITQTVPSSPMGGLKTGTSHSTTVYNSKEFTEKKVPNEQKTSKQVLMGFGEARNNTMASVGGSITAVGDFIQIFPVKGDLGLGWVRNIVVAAAGEAMQYSLFPGIRKVGKFISTTYNNDTTARQNPGHVLDLPKLGRNISKAYNKDAAAQLKRGYNPDETAAKITRASSEAIPMVVGGGIVVKGLLKIPAVATVVVKGFGWVASKPLLAGGLKIGGTALVAAPVVTSAVNKDVEGVTKGLIYAGAAGAAVKMAGRTLKSLRPIASKYNASRAAVTSERHASQAALASKRYRIKLEKELAIKHQNPFSQGHGPELEIRSSNNIAPHEAATPILARWSSLFPKLNASQTEILLEHVEALAKARGMTLAQVEEMFVTSRNAQGDIMPSLAIAQAQAWKSAVGYSGIKLSDAMQYLSPHSNRYIKGATAKDIVAFLKGHEYAFQAYRPNLNMARSSPHEMARMSDTAKTLAQRETMYFSEMLKETRIRSYSNTVSIEQSAINTLKTYNLCLKEKLTFDEFLAVNNFRIGRGQSGATSITPEQAVHTYLQPQKQLKATQEARDQIAGEIYQRIDVNQRLIFNAARIPTGRYGAEFGITPVTPLHPTPRQIKTYEPNKRQVRSSSPKRTLPSSR